MQGLTQGQQVHYVHPDTGAHRAAVIVKSDVPQEDMAPALVELYVYPCNEDYTTTEVDEVPLEEQSDLEYTELVSHPALPLGPNSNPWSTYDPNCAPGTWHWREPA